MSELADEQLEETAEATILAAANLTCGTTTGILAHPYTRRADDGGGPRWPHFDVLVIDEASKTTFQEFLVPAQLACKWIIVGDVRQLPPFTDPRDLEVSLADVNDESGRKFPSAYQRACLLLFRLGRREAGAGRTRWLIEEPVDVLEALVAEHDARRAKGALGKAPREPGDLEGEGLTSDLRRSVFGCIPEEHQLALGDREEGVRPTITSREFDLERRVVGHDDRADLAATQKQRQAGLEVPGRRVLEQRYHVVQVNLTVHTQEI
jgi:hypothetical protein